MIEYLVNGKSQAIEYASSTHREGGEVYTPIAGEGGSFTLGSRFMGLMDEFRIHSAWIERPGIQKYSVPSGRVETRAIDLGGGNSGILKVEVLGGRSSVSGGRVENEFRENGRFRFTDDSELQFFIRTAENPYSWNDADWRTFTPGADLPENIHGRYVQIAADFYPSGDGETSPYLEEIRIVYMPDDAPLPPASLVAVALDGAVQLNWKNSPDTDTAGYLVYYGTVKGEYFGEDAALGKSPINVGKRNSIVIDGLKNGVLYYFAVAAYDHMEYGGSGSYHMGEFSREAPARPLEGLTAQLLRAPE
jgi:hypothetical protein